MDHDDTAPDPVISKSFKSGAGKTEANDDIRYIHIGFTYINPPVLDKRCYVESTATATYRHLWCKDHEPFSSPSSFEQSALDHCRGEASCCASGGIAVGFGQKTSQLIAVVYKN